MKIAVIGSGISGLSVTWLLSSQHEVTLYEKDNRLGGHAHTVKTKDSQGNVLAVDTGFMVFNPVQYPNLVKLFEHFNITITHTSMSFSVSIDNGAFEFSSKVLDGVFADRQNILRVPFYEFLLEIKRFNATASKALAEGISPHQTLWEFLKEHTFSEDLAEKYILPLVGSIWSTPKKLARDFPCAELLGFLNNHHLLSLTGHGLWRTVEGGSSVYVERVAEEIRSYGGVVRSHTTVRAVHRSDKGVMIETKEGKEHFDYVVIATHADEALALLAEPTREEKILLSKFKYEKNEVYLHNDISLMPRRKEAWAAWNYLGYRGWGRKTRKVCLTYHMNELQGIVSELPTLVTLNPPRKPKAALTHGKFSYAHLMCSCTSMEMRNQLKNLQNKKRTLFCGSYFGYGFHEDGIASAVEAVRYLGIQPPWNHEA